MTENEAINGWTFEETIKTAESLMEAEENMFKWDVLRHLRDFAENYKDKVQQFEAIGTIEEFKGLKEKSVLKLARFDKRCNKHVCPSCNGLIEKLGHCRICGQRVAHEALPGETVETIGYADQSGLMSAT